MGSMFLCFIWKIKGEYERKPLIDASDGAAGAGEPLLFFSFPHAMLLLQLFAWTASVFSAAVSSR